MRRRRQCGQHRVAIVGEREGLLVRVFEPGSPAAAAGLRQGDLIVAAGSGAVSSVDDLYDVLDRAATEGTLALTVVRGTDDIEVQVSFTDATYAPAEEGSS